MSQIYFIRHAQASYLQANYDQLSAHGQSQSEALGRFLVENEVHFDKIFVGPLVRQQQTQQIVADVYQKHALLCHAPIVLSELAEHAGPDALRYLQPTLAARDPQIKRWNDEILENPALKKRNSLLLFAYFMQKWATGQITDADALYEPWGAFRQRVKKAVEIILANTSSGQTVGVFTSGGVVAAAVAEATHTQNEAKVAALNYSVRNASFTQFKVTQNEFNLLAFNEVPHLSKEMITFI